jgi:ABC-type transporter lipoprotein component MlaA
MISTEALARKRGTEGWTRYYYLAIPLLGYFLIRDDCHHHVSLIQLRKYLVWVSLDNNYTSSI